MTRTGRVVRRPTPRRRAVSAPPAEIRITEDQRLATGDTVNAVEDYGSTVYVRLRMASGRALYAPRDSEIIDGVITSRT